MGRATIVEHLGDALYKVQIHRDSQRVRAVIDKWVAEADSIDAQCAELEAEGSELEAAALDAKESYEQAQVASEDQAEINRLLSKYLSALAEWEAAANKIFGLQAHARHLRNKASNMEAELAPREDEAWCSTYTTSLAPGTEVATIEVARQGDDYPYHVIAPDGRAPTPDDGQMRSVMSMTPAQTFLNYALWPGAVRWYPRYREGVVYDIDDANQRLQVLLNTPDLPGMQDSYLPEWLLRPSSGCTGQSAYELGDRVIVACSPEKEVIGWAEWPKEVYCDPRITFGEMSYLDLNVCNESIVGKAHIEITFPPEDENVYLALTPADFSFEGVSAFFHGRYDNLRKFVFFIDPYSMPIFNEPRKQDYPDSVTWVPPGDFTVKAINPIDGTLIASTLHLGWEVIDQSDPSHSWNPYFRYTGFENHWPHRIAAYLAHSVWTFGERIDEDETVPYDSYSDMTMEHYVNGNLVGRLDDSRVTAYHSSADGNPQTFSVGVAWEDGKATDADVLGFSEDQRDTLPDILFHEAVFTTYAEITLHRGGIAWVKTRLRMAYTGYK